MRRGLCLFALFMVALCFCGNVRAKDNMKGYLFTYFTGNSVEEESIRFALSYDGYHYVALNDGRPVLLSGEISSTGGVRDPHILRCEDGKTFYMVATDMVSAKGWDSNRAIVLMKSKDLINWTSQVVNIQQKYKGQENLKRVWAPQTIYNPEVGKYMVYFSMKHGNGADIIYYAYANKDFTDLESEPKVLFSPASGKSCIDGDIVFKNGRYHLFYKTEGDGNGIKKAVTLSLTSGRWVENDNYLQQTKEAVEGSSVFRLGGTDTYILMYDMYMTGKYQLTESTDLENFKEVNQSVSMNFKPRHGSVIPLTEKEINRLVKKWSLPGNPILHGYYADPDIMYSHKTGKFYLYPTSDGFTGWSGKYFKTFSSKDLTNWKEEGVILDLPSQVSWANRNAWAPCIEEKLIDGKYKYFYYFTAAQKVGVAVADDPTGPFVDSGKALIDSYPAGVTWGQQIDPDVFTDPVTGKSYLYWGNGYMAAAALNDDMVSIDESSVKVMTPDDTFREAVYVFYRNGLYYFLWSEDDTRSENYRVRYGTSDSPMGPIKKPENNLILSKDPSAGIYGTGHNSVLQIPGRDEWYMVYHRFSRPEGIKMGDAAGFHREVCIDLLEFNEDGTIRPVKPTLEGVAKIKPVGKKHK